MNSYNVFLTDEAQEDLIMSEKFYESISPGLGVYFRDSIIADLDALRFFGKIHEKHFDFYRMITKRFPYAIYYDIENGKLLIVHAILDTRRKPEWIEHRLQR